MYKGFKIVKIILISGVAIFVTANVLWELLSLTMTRNSSKLYSPDRRYYAQVEETNGGATTSFMTDIMVADAKSTIINFGFFYTGNDTNRKWVFGFDGALDSVKLQWVDTHTLKVKYQYCSELHGKPDKSWKDIKIVYEGQCSKDN